MATLTCTRRPKLRVFRSVGKKGHMTFFLPDIFFLQTPKNRCFFKILVLLMSFMNKNITVFLSKPALYLSFPQKMDDFSDFEIASLSSDFGCYSDGKFILYIVYVELCSLIYKLKRHIKHIHCQTKKKIWNIYKS